MTRPTTNLDTLLATLDAKLTDMRAMIAEAREQKSEPGGGWSEWLEWRGGRCPLPGGTRVKIERRDTVVFNIADAASVIWACTVGTLGIRRFRYRATDALGWLPRGGWIPPAELFDEASPMRLEWLVDDGVAPYSGDWLPSTWRGVTHIRLVARERKVELPEGFRIDEDGALWSEFGPVLNRRERDRYRPAAIRQAVDVWLREMGDE